MNKCKYKAFGLVGFITALILCLTLFSVSAADAGTVELKASGSEAELLMNFPQAAAEEIASMQITLNISASSGADIEFVFNSSITAKITEARYHSDTGVLNIIVTNGTGALFSESAPLTVGKVRISGSGASATVKVEEGSIKFVRGSELVSPSDVTYPRAVTISTAASSSSSSSSSLSSSSSSVSSSASSSFSSSSSVGSSASSSSSFSSSSSSSAASTHYSSVPNAQNSPVDTASLLSALERAENYKESDYTQSSYNALSDAITNAQALLSDISYGSITQEDIDEALLELENSMAMLVPINEAPTGNNSSDGSGNSGNSDNSSSGGTENNSGSDSTSSSENVPEENNAVIWIIVSVMAVILVALVTAIIIIRRRKK